MLSKNATLKTVKYILAIVTTAVAAYYSAILVRSIQDGQARSEAHAKARIQTTEILEAMNSLYVGGELSDWTMEDIDGKSRRFSELVEDRALFTIVDPSCESCVLEMRSLSSALKDGQDSRKVVIISTASPHQMRVLQQEAPAGCTILLDKDGRFVESINIVAYPFNILVNSQLAILEIHARPLFEDEIEELLSL